MKEFTRDEIITGYWHSFYCAQCCTLCGNWGWIDSVDVRTPAGVSVGRVNWCICPNGQVCRAQVGGCGPSQSFLADQKRRAWHAQ